MCGCSTKTLFTIIAVSCAGLSLSIGMLLARNAWGKSFIHFRSACLKGKGCPFKTIIRTLNEASQLGTFTWVEVPNTMKLACCGVSLEVKCCPGQSPCLSAQREKDKFSKERDDLV